MRVHWDNLLSFSTSKEPARKKRKTNTIRLSTCFLKGSGSTSPFISYLFDVVNGMSLISVSYFHPLSLPTEGNLEYMGHMHCMFLVNPTLLLST